MKDTPFDSRRRSLLRALAAGAATPLLPASAAANAGTGLLRKPIPASGERLPVVGLGTSGVFEVGSSEAERRGPLQALTALQGLGNAMVDTSPMYGEAERVIGELLPQLPEPSRFFLATKVWTRGKRAGIEQMNESARLLGSATLDLIQVHNLVDWRTHVDTLREWKVSGRIRYMGITHYREDAHDDLMRVMQAVPDLDFVQVNYSLLEPAAEQRLLPLARERGVAIIANRPFARGGWFRLTRGRDLPAWATELGIGSWAQFGLKWIVSHPAVTCTIPGTGNARHMLDNMQASSGQFLDRTTRQQMRDYLRDI
jgi:diketogulonate reductase-like aldo/keto reductase